MSNNFYFYPLGILLLFFAACKPSSPEGAPEKARLSTQRLSPAAYPSANAAAGFALVELFTSEGCSSCPPADKVAAEMARLADSTRVPVYVLAYHVDYWNRLGWHDRFSAPEFSARQNWYAQIWQSSQMYTPQWWSMVRWSL
ncbi:MAG: DUF1223 domain-containing protein [Microscillaceae bacterium]|nr:DUF1223 domain-containing protein [Microscillaceae bacterium]